MLTMAVKSSLTILFEDPFWIGVFERTGDGKYEVCKITFGAEPKDYEVRDLLLYNWNNLKFSPPVNDENHGERHINPKRMHRKINRQSQSTGVGTKAQQALKLQHEQNKTEKKTKNGIQKETMKKRQYALRQEKKKARHKGQ